MPFMYWAIESTKSCAIALIKRCVIPFCLLCVFCCVFLLCLFVVSFCCVFLLCLLLCLFVVSVCCVFCCVFLLCPLCIYSCVLHLCFERYPELEIMANENYGGVPAMAKKWAKVVRKRANNERAIQVRFFGC